MQKQIIEIEVEVPDGKKAVWKDGRIVFKDIEPLLPNTWEEFCENTPIGDEFYIDSSSQIVSPGWTTRDECVNANILPSHEAAEAHLAYMQLHQLRNRYRQGWVPTDDKVSFGIVRKSGGRLDIDRFMFSSRFLTFQSKEIAEKFLRNFRDYIVRAGDLI